MFCTTTGSEEWSDWSLFFSKLQVFRFQQFKVKWNPGELSAETRLDLGRFSCPSDAWLMVPLMDCSLIYGEVSYPNYSSTNRGVLQPTQGKGGVLPNGT